MTLKFLSKYLFMSLFTAVFSFSAVISSNAQQDNVINSVEEAITIALKNNSSIIEAKLDKLKAEKKVSEVYSDNLVPTISLNSRYQRAIRKQTFDIFGERYEIGSDNSITNTFDVSESLPVLGTPVFTAIRIADYYEKSQTQNVTAVENNIKKM
ncbi:MAG: TolC family protein [Ignavibacteria bacterium]|nr:TolC family protein [Ignavibacteria bacterium]